MLREYVVFVNHCAENMLCRVHVAGAVLLLDTATARLGASDVHVAWVFCAFTLPGPVLAIETGVLTNHATAFFDADLVWPHALQR